MEPDQCRVINNVLAIRSDPDTAAEMVSQAVFGEYVALLDNSGEFSRIRTSDDYEGWCLSHQIELRSAVDAEELWTVTSAFAEALSGPQPTAQMCTRLSIGSRLHVVHSDGDYVRVNEASNVKVAYWFVLKSCLRRPGISPGFRTDQIERTALSLLGTPYLWGGTSSFGCDCSGFTQRVFGIHGVNLPRDAYQQAASACGVRTGGADVPSALDLVFFLGKRDPRMRGITHVGIALDYERFIHSSGARGVAISRFDDDEIVEEYRFRGGLRLPSPGS